MSDQQDRIAKIQQDFAESLAAYESQKKIAQIQQDIAKSLAADDEKAICDSKMSDPQKTIAQIQQDFAKSLAAADDEKIVYDLYAANQADGLKSKIEILNPDTENSKTNKGIQKMRDTLFESIWAQRKYTNKNLLSTIIYVLVTKETNPLSATNFSFHPVFVIKRCHLKDDPNTFNCCKIFVDEEGRVYQNWQSYLNDNVLPEGTLVAPLNGIYTFNKNDKVKLCRCETPASGVGRQIVKVADKGAFGFGLAALGVLGGAIFFPIAAPVVAVASATAIGTSIYSGGRSSSQLYDRKKHEQSISLKNREARGNWISVAASGAGVGASAATGTLTKLATSGQNISNTTKFFVNGANLTSITVSGAGVGNGVIDLFLKKKNGEDVTMLDMFQFSTSLLLFTHSVRNFKLASNIVRETQNNQIRAYREQLSNRNRKSFDKLSRQQLSINGENQGRSDIIRTLNESPETHTLNKMRVANRETMQQNAQNNPKAAEANFKSATEFYRDINQMNSNNINVNKNKLTSKNKDNLGFVETAAPIIFEGIFYYFSETLERKIAITITKDVSNKIIDENDFANTANLFVTIGEELCDEALKILDKFITSILDGIENVIKISLPSEFLLLKFYDMFIEPFLKNKKDELIYFLKYKKERIFEHLKDDCMTLNPLNPIKSPEKCKFCPGFFSIVKL